MANVNNNSIMPVKTMATPLTPRKSSLEVRHAQFTPELIGRAMASKTSAAPLMRDLNKIQALLDGMGVVMRIVSGNTTLKDCHDPEDAASEAPLSDSAIDSLTRMVAELCESISDDICMRAQELDDEVPA